VSARAFAGKFPRLANGVYVAPTATVIGDVEVGEDASIWFGAVLRGDVGAITVGQRTNVQDLSIVHMTSGVSETRLGDNVTVGHGVILHGCLIGDRCLVGMGTIVLDNVRIGHDSLIGAGSLLPPDMVVPPRSFALGRPARILRTTTEEEVAGAIERARHYVELARAHRASDDAQPPPTK
jgi:carbonic anhydrase/acetyltransferase-like protein (isoleucine patch superfamily)